MDPFFTASTPAPRAKRRSRHKNLSVSENRDAGQPSELHAKEPQPKALSSSSALSSSKSLTGLRRSTGLFNLKINKEDEQPPFHYDGMSPPDLAQDTGASNGTSTSPTEITALESLADGNETPVSRRRSDVLSLKRPHPFSTSKPTPKPWGFLSRSSNASLASPQKSKRLHVTDSTRVRHSYAGFPQSRNNHGSDTVATINPDLSFSGAKPVQTAFASAGLQSKKHMPQTPKPRVPETPVKRPVNADTLADQKHYMYQSNLPLDHGSPFPGVASNNLMQLDPTSMSSTDSLNSWLELSVGNRLHTPIDRLKRFSIGHIEDSDLTDTPTRHSEAENNKAKLIENRHYHHLAHQQHPVPPHHYQFPYQSRQHRNASTSSIPSRPVRPPLPPLPVVEKRNGYNEAAMEFDNENHKANVADDSDLINSEFMQRFQDSEEADDDLSNYCTGAGRQGSEAITVTPGTAVKPKARPVDSQVLRSADPTDSMSMSPLWSRDTMSFADSTGPRTPGKFANDSLPSPSFAESQSSPRPRHQLRILGGLRQNEKSPASKLKLQQTLRSLPSSASTAVSLGSAGNSFGSGNIMLSSGSSLSPSSNEVADNEKIAEPTNTNIDEAGPTDDPGLPLVPPPLRLETPLGRTHYDLSPKTPATTIPFFDSPSSETGSNGSSVSIPGTAGRSESALTVCNATESSMDIDDGNLSQPQYPRTWGNTRTASHDLSSGPSSTRGCSSRSIAANCRPKDEDPCLYDPHLISKFEKVQSAARGEFSCVFVVVQGRQRFAVKRTKKPLVGQRDRSRQREEIDILRTLSSQPNDSHVIQMVDEWEHANFGYIMTEFCENGDLNTFLAAQGRVSRLEEWRVWKILVEVLHGLAVIHSHNILHLDLKPANVFVSFEGHLKIGDFGMATRCPPPPGFEREGDREYIAPEVLERHQYGKPADIFSVGLMMVEVAANIVLPDNGVHWHRLRSGDLSDAGRLSSGDLAMNVGNASALSNVSGSSNLSAGSYHGSSVPPRNVPSWAPRFLVNDSCLLDKVVSLMLSPQPERRPTVAQLLTMPELMLVYQRGQAGAIVYEGEFGPEPEMAEENSVWQRT